MTTPRVPRRLEGILVSANAFGAALVDRESAAEIGTIATTESRTGITTASSGVVPAGTITFRTFAPARVGQLRGLLVGRQTWEIVSAAPPGTTGRLHLFMDAEPPSLVNPGVVRLADALGETRALDGMATFTERVAGPLSLPDTGVEDLPGGEQVEPGTLLFIGWDFEVVTPGAGTVDFDFHVDPDPLGANRALFELGWGEPSSPRGV